MLLFVSKLRPWINRITWLNYTFIRSCKINFLIYKTSFWKFGKRNKKKPFFLTRGVSKRKDLMKISKVIFHIKPIPSLPWWECNKAHLFTSFQQKFWKKLDNLSVITGNCKNVHSNEVDRRSVSFSVVFSKFSAKYFVKLKSYLTWTFTGIWWRGLVDQ